MNDYEFCALRINNETIVGCFKTNIVWYIQQLIKNILYNHGRDNAIPIKFIANYLYTNIKYSYYNPTINCENKTGYYIFISTLYNKIYFSLEGFDGTAICFSWDKFVKLSLRENIKVREFYENLYKFLEMV